MQHFHLVYTTISCLLNPTKSLDAHSDTPNALSSSDLSALSRGDFSTHQRVSASRVYTFGPALDGGISYARYQG
jgi:hypothetical protein